MVWFIVSTTFFLLHHVKVLFFLQHCLIIFVHAGSSKSRTQIFHCYLSLWVFSASSGVFCVLIFVALGFPLVYCKSNFSLFIFGFVFKVVFFLHIVDLCSSLRLLFLFCVLHDLIFLFFFSLVVFVVLFCYKSSLVMIVLFFLHHYYFISVKVFIFMTTM